MTQNQDLRLWFSRFASRIARLVGHPNMFLIAVVLLFEWGASGPFFHHSDTWQSIINTSTTIVTFLVVFLIQNTQNRDAKALHGAMQQSAKRTELARTDWTRETELVVHASVLGSPAGFLGAA